MKNNVDLGKYDLNQLLRNPGLVHSIQDALMKIEGDGAFTKIIREGAWTDINECIKMIVAQYPHNPKMIIKIVGKKTLEMIEEFAGVTLANDLNDVL